MFNFWILFWQSLWAAGAPHLEVPQGCFFAHVWILFVLTAACVFGWTSPTQPLQSKYPVKMQHTFTKEWVFFLTVFISLFHIHSWRSLNVCVSHTNLTVFKSKIHCEYTSYFTVVFSSDQRWSTNKSVRFVRYKCELGLHHCLPP